MRYRKLDANQRKEIELACTTGKVHPQELANYYGVSITTVKNVLADAGLGINNARKTPTQSALLEHLKAMGITDVDSLKRMMASKHYIKSQYNKLSLDERVNWFTQSVVQQLHDPTLTDFDKEIPNATPNHPTEQVQLI